MKGKYLITTDNFFHGSDGKSYRAAWGNVEIIEDVFLGLKTNRNSTNWYAKVGSDENHVIIAGCQIHYAVKSEEKPNTLDTEDLTLDSENKKYLRPNSIYIAE